MNAMLANTHAISSITVLALLPLSWSSAPVSDRGGACKADTAT